jgi:hypothetical protein
MGNLRLLSQKIFDVRDLPFNNQNEVQDFRVLMPVERSGNVATFTFNAKFTASVPLESINKTLVANRPYMFYFRMIRGIKEA